MLYGCNGGSTTIPSIAGIVNLKRQPIDRASLERMSLAGWRYGPGHAGEWFGACEGFAFRGPKPGCAIRESQPFSDAESGIVVLLDGRVDGREALIAACRERGFAPRGTADAELVLRAYQSYGAACPQHILGEYAFIVWDSMHCRLVAARDPAGTRPLFYTHLPDGQLRIATGANQLLCDPVVPRTADIVGMLDFLVGRSYYEPHRTPCESIRRVPAGHTLVADPKGVLIRQHWCIVTDRSVQTANWEESLESCTAALAAAICDRTQRGAPVGISLSGGWDSGAIFTLWQWMRSRGEDLATPWTYTYYGDDAADDEREQVRELLRRWPDAQCVFQHRPQEGVLEGLDEHIEQLGMPDYSPAWRTVRQQGAQARRAGVNLILNGEGGNTVFQSSHLKCVDLFCAGRMHDAREQVNTWSVELQRSARDFAIYLAKRALLHRMATFRQMARRARRLVSGHSSSLGWLTASAQIRVQEFVAPMELERQKLARGQSLAAWEYQTAFSDMSRDLYVMPPALDLEGVTAGAPYLDRRVQAAALAALLREPAPSPSRELLGCVLERTAGQRLVGNYAHMTAHTESRLLSDLRAGNDLFRFTALKDLGIVHHDRAAFLQTEQALQQYGLATIWRLLALETWARRWLGT